MMRSLFSGVSGLKGHQTRMDVIGNNIANVNTTGFKSSRTTFADTFSQTTSGASSPTGNLGGTNPKQIGLGANVSSIDLIFTDGSVQSTGKNTDLCLSGNGLFVVNQGNQTFYTRNGAFEFDAEGNYVMPGSGLFVQGWTAQDGVLNTSGAVGNITIPSGKTMAAKMTDIATYTNNLNASIDGYEIAGILVSYADGTSETVSSYEPTAAGSITLGLSSGGMIKLDETAEYSFQTGQAVTGKTLYTSKIESIEATTDGTVKLTLASTGSGAEVEGYTAPTLSSGTYKLGDTYTLTGVIQEGGVITDGSEEGMTELTVKLTDEQIVKFKVPTPTPFTYQDGDTVSFDFKISQIEAAAKAKVTTENGYTAVLSETLSVTSADQKYARKGTAEDGTVVSVSHEGNGYSFHGKQVKSTTITTKDGKTLSGLLGKDYSAGNMFYPSVTTTVEAYDSEGSHHSVPVLFTKTGSNTWELSLVGGADTATIEESDGSVTTVTLEKTALVFDELGGYVSGGGTLTFNYSDDNGAKDAQKVTLNLGALTQYAGTSTIYGSANGNAAGSLSSISIDSSGIITGTYTNGIKQAEAQVAVAQFNNASGLTKTGNSLYQESNNSGTANVKTAADLGVTITGSALEMSNVDIANEFSDMIITQRGFQSNSKIITVSDELLETVINMKR